MTWWTWSMLSVLLWGVWGFLAKLALQQVKWQSMLLIACLTYIVLYAAFAIALYIAYRPSLQVFSPPQTGSTLLIVVATAAGFGGVIPFYLALDLGKAAIVVPLTAGYSVITVLLSLTLLGEGLRPTQFVAVILFIAAAILASR